ncbi:mRNA export protein mlo3 [Hypsizygus marmoreus]|uniref:mRNA export protein mlo3 n=1 Tax=Hypsizygus marmoreus TaxID=39966 RepID=A0A369KB53_HYPMA|nr:mRNA export protein mlo3 [Hypsizygus marmoreus]
MNGQPYARLNTFHGPKRQLLGNQAGYAAPAWRNVPPIPGQVIGKGKHVAQDSKIFLSKLPLDVGEKEVEELFRKTVGPLRESFLIYNSQGKSKGMAVVTFQRPGDAAVARAKYDGKIVDGRRPLKIEIMVDNTPSNMPPPPPPMPSLLTRLGGKAKITPNKQDPPPTQPRQHKRPPAQAQPATIMVSNGVPAPTRRVRYKKGPKRIKKVIYSPLTRDQLDKEMEDYRASADISGL